jgi:hypothetical protein
MPKKQPDTKDPTTHGGFRWSKPAELKHVRVNIMLSPEAIQLLEPYTRTGQRSKIIDAAVKEFLKQQKGS